MSATLQLSSSRAAALTEPIRKAAGQLLSQQDPAGFWWGELTADTTLESDYILLQLWMHPPQGAVWNPPTKELIGKAVKSILDRQLPDGGFNVYAKGPSDVSATIKAYFALKLAGIDYNDPRLAQARERILALGGFQAANSYVKINLSLFDLYPREQVPVSDVFLDPRYRRLAGNCACAQSAAAGARRVQPAGAFPAGRSLGIREERKDHLLAERISSVGSRAEVVGAAWKRPHPAKSDPRGGALDG